MTIENKQAAASRDALLQSRQNHAEFEQQLAELEAAPAAQPVQVDESLVELVKTAHNARDDAGRSRYQTDSQHRERVESAYRLAFSGASKAQVEAALRGEQPGAAAQPASAPATEPADDDGGAWTAGPVETVLGRVSVPGVELDADVVGGWAKAAKAAGTSPQQFAAALREYAKDNGF